MDSQRKNLAVLVEGYLHVDQSGSTEALLEQEKNGRGAAEPKWKRFYCVLERRVMCFYQQSPWISASPIKIEFRLPVTLTSLCRITARKAGSYYANKVSKRRGRVRLRLGLWYEGVGGMRCLVALVIGNWM